MDGEISIQEIASLGLAIVGCFSLPTLLGLWLSQLRLHWLWQTLLIVATASPLILICAFDLMLIILVNALLVLVCSKLWQGWQERSAKSSDDAGKKSWFQVRLQDALAAFILLAVVAAMLAQTPKANVWGNDPSTVFWGVSQCLIIGAAAAVWGTSLLVLPKLRSRFWTPWLALMAVSSVAAGWNLFTMEKFRHGWYFPHYVSRRSLRLFN